MEKTLVIVSSQTGFTSRYAQWLAEDTGADVVALEKVLPRTADPYQTIVFGSAVYGGEYGNAKKFRKLRQKYKDKTFLYYATGIRPPTEQTINAIRSNNFPNLAQASLFYFQGGLDREKLDVAKKTLLTCYGAMIRRRGEIREEDDVFLDRIQRSGDYTDRDSVAPLTQKVLEL